MATLKSQSHLRRNLRSATEHYRQVRAESPRLKIGDAPYHRNRYALLGGFCAGMDMNALNEEAHSGKRQLGCNHLLSR